MAKHRPRLIKLTREYNRVVLALSMLCEPDSSLSTASNKDIADHLKSIGLKIPMAGIERAIREIEDDDSFAVFTHACRTHRHIVFLCDDDSMTWLELAASFEHYWLRSNSPRVRELVRKLQAGEPC